LIDNVLSASATPTKSGYKYGLTSAGGTPVGDYTVSAAPVSWANTGSANWCSNPDAVIKSTKALATQPTASATLPVGASACSDATQYVAIQ
jgi:hypothetical protein